MPVVDFKLVKEEMEEAQDMNVMQVLIRSSLAHGADNTPHLLILTDKAIYWGGTADMANEFNRISLASVIESKMAGRSLWETVKLTHMEIDGEKTIYITPFIGEFHMPEKDMESMELLIQRCAP